MTVAADDHEAGWVPLALEPTQIRYAAACAPIHVAATIQMMKKQEVQKRLTAAAASAAVVTDHVVPDLQMVPAGDLLPLLRVVLST